MKIFFQSRQNKYLLLLTALVIFFLITPMMPPAGITMTVFSLSFSLIFFVAIYEIVHRKWVALIAFTLALISVGIHWADTVYGVSRTINSVEYISSFLFFLLVTYVTLRHVMCDTEISNSTLYGAVCGYLMIGLSWSFIYSTLFIFDAQSFTIQSTVDDPSSARMVDFVYFSFVTLSTLGYGDVVPTTRIAQTFSWVEAITGQIYLAVWISRLVGLNIAHSLQRKARKKRVVKERLKEAQKEKIQ